MPPRRRPESKATARNRAGAEGSTWRRMVAQVVSRDLGVCHICGHPGAKSADHLIPVTERPDLARVPANLKAAHAYPRGCPVCSAAASVKAGKVVIIYCNEIRGAFSIERARRVIGEKTGKEIAPGQKTEGNSGERGWLLPDSYAVTAHYPQAPSL